MANGIYFSYLSDFTGYCMDRQEDSGAQRACTIKFFYTTSIIYINQNLCYSTGRKKKRSTVGQKGKDMTAIIRLFSLNSEHRDAQLKKKELGYDCARPFKDRLERMNCVDEPGWS